MERDTSFGHWVYSRRRELRLSRVELAAQVGCAAVTMRKIEEDARRPSPQMAALLAERLGLAPPARAIFVRVARGELNVEHLAALPLASPDSLPAPASAVQRERIPTPLRTNLPAPLTSFVGRETELAEIAAAVADHRLVTLTGVGGVGKTRLCIEAGIRMVRGGSADIAPDGVWLVELAALAEPTLVAPAIARAFRLHEQPGRSALEQLQDHLADTQLLLILDNCEHLVDGCATVAEQLLLRCWRLRIFATSRELLRVPGEWAYPVAPLALPALSETRPAQVLAAPAAQLFVARMDAGRAPTEAAGIVAIAQICRQLDGIPLALELAAPLAQSLALPEIARQLQDHLAILTNAYRTAIPRHQTMHSALVWSYRLLAPAEQRLLARCAVFAGGWTPEAAEAVCADGEPVRGRLERLAASSLALREGQGGQARYRLLEPVRQFAQAQLAARGDEEAAVCGRHAAHFLSMLAARGADLKGARQIEALGEIAKESENVRAAWRWATEAGAIGLLAPAVGALGLAYEWLGRSAEGLAAMGGAVDMVSAAPLAPAELYAILLAGQARFAFLLGDGAGAAGLLTQAQIALDTRGSGGAATDGARAEVLLHCGRCLASQDLVVARDALAQSQALFHALGDRWGEATSMAEMGLVANSLHGNYAKAVRFLEQSVTLYRSLGDRVGLSKALLYLSQNHRYLNRVPESLALAREAYAIAEELDNPRAIAHAAGNLGSALEWSGDYDESYAMLHRALAITYDLGHRSELPAIYHALGLTTLYLGRYVEARATYTTGLAAAQAVDATLEAGGLLFCLAMVALAEGAYMEARALAEEAIAVNRRIGDEFGLLIARTICAFADYRLGDQARARASIITALRTELLKRNPMHWGFWLIALMLADDGAPERAAATFALAEQIRHEDNVWAQDIVLREVRAIIAALPPDVAAAAQARWAGRDVWEAAAELLTELEAEGWGVGGSEEPERTIAPRP